MGWGVEDWGVDSAAVSGIRGRSSFSLTSETAELGAIPGYHIKLSRAAHTNIAYVPVR